MDRNGNKYLVGWCPDCGRVSVIRGDDEPTCGCGHELLSLTGCADLDEVAHAIHVIEGIRDAALGRTPSLKAVSYTHLDVYKRQFLRCRRHLTPGGTLMELLQLRYFMVAARHQHITHAAEELHIAQPALSQSIQRLEAELGVPLFDRKNRGIFLNDAGRLLQKKLYPILFALDSLPRELQEANDFSSHTIHLNLLGSAAPVSYTHLRPAASFGWETASPPCTALTKRYMGRLWSLKTVSREWCRTSGRIPSAASFLERIPASRRAPDVYKRQGYIPYLIAVAIYIGVSNIIGLFGFKPPTKDMNVTAALAIMSIVPVSYTHLDVYKRQLLQSIYEWVRMNEVRNEHFHDGRYWDRDSIDALAQLFPYFTKRQIQYTLEKLEKHGLILVGNYNEQPLDQTRWYALTDKAYELFEPLRRR